MQFWSNSIPKKSDRGGFESISSEFESAKSHISPPSRPFAHHSNNEKTRPLGIPTVDDKLVQAVVRMLLVKVYEPIFSDVQYLLSSATRKAHGMPKSRCCA